jgi:antitoxin component HigA of HigAB toxin-antitoxin module
MWWRFFGDCATNAPHKKEEGSIMRKHRIERNLAFPSEEFRAKVRTAAKQRGFRTERAFLIAACEHELERGNNTEAMDDLEARVLATLANVAKEVQALFTLVHSKRHVTAVLTTRREVNFERARRLDSTVAIPRCD